ncbi:7157_t:CDS:2 [Funneliformis mosseae]|uniref:7157_t:CDS:1 n=1 Tax=Funneliformis mosseae TaxID=27381 RepID=A0A9N8YNT3_FUNMO|nr:7157_t:CDS:2 [Funneliformis mosseae]
MLKNISYSNVTLYNKNYLNSSFGLSLSLQTIIKFSYYII